MQSISGKHGVARENTRKLRELALSRLKHGFESRRERQASGAGMLRYSRSFAAIDFSRRSDISMIRRSLGPAPAAAFAKR